MAPVTGSCKKKRDTESSPVSELSDDLLVEIFSRVPYKSTCCCKCVSRRWRDLVSHPDHRKKLPQSTLAGIFYQIRNKNTGYQSLSGNWCASMDPSLSFMLPKHDRFEMHLLDGCNGFLLLCRRRTHLGPKNIADYVVCNPVTERWVVVRATNCSSNASIARLGFDPAVSSHFHVFEFAPAGFAGANRPTIAGATTDIKSVGIYSSQAAVWARRAAWKSPISVRRTSESVFFRGMLHLCTNAGLVIGVGVEGNRRVIRAPMTHSDGDVHNVYLSQGQLHFANKGASEQSIGALEGSNGENWTLKHNVTYLQLLGIEFSSFVWNYDAFVHPEKNQAMATLRCHIILEGTILESSKRCVASKAIILVSHQLGNILVLLGLRPNSFGPMP
ncbi:hypothetical protein VPH35_062652 [Triticum aestivum]|uniref:Uncharacterized protein n=1 Tax=Aegilops tauschii TaxID=37682 RepID=M8B530_AEGTA